MSERFVLESEMPVSAEELFAWHERPGAFERLNPPFEPVRIIERDQGLHVGARTEIEVKVGPVPMRLIAEHTAYEPGVMFRDEQKGGPFSKWVHTHRMVPASNGKSVLRDEIEYEAPLGAIGQAVGGPSILARLERTFRYRHALTHADLQRHAKYQDRPRQTVAITGANGMIGQALTAFLTTGGHTVRLVKRGDFEALEACDAIVHLAGAPIAESWSDHHRKEMIASRVEYTRAMVDALRGKKSLPKVLLSGSAIGVYGDRGDEVLTEQSAAGAPGLRGAAMLAKLCVDWENEALKARELGIRVALLRTGIVLSPLGGALEKLLLPFKAGVGGAQGTGKQWMSPISMEDELGAIHHALFEEVEGPVDLTLPTPVTNSEFARTLGKVLGRPHFAKVPAVALKALFGEMAEATILASQRVLPGVLQKTGFSFLHPTVEEALRFPLGV